MLKELKELMYQVELWEVFYMGNVLVKVWEKFDESLRRDMSKPCNFVHDRVILTTIIHSVVGFVPCLLLRSQTKAISHEKVCTNKQSIYKGSP